jgi:macrolide-specific efflux system membrane fusion protein
LGFIKRHPFIVTAVLIAVAGASFYFAREEEKAEKPLLAEVEVGDVENAVTAAGSLKPKRIVEVGAQVSGQLERLHVDVGDVVTVGQLLAEIDATVQENRVEASRASLRAQEAQMSARQAGLRLAQANAARQERLMAANATSQADLENAVNSLASAQSSLVQLQSQIERSRAELATQEAELGYTKIYAPRNGTVVDIASFEGQTLNANDTTPIILSIANLDTMTVQAKVSEADVALLDIGMKVYFTTLGGGERRWESRVTQIVPSPAVENNVVLYPVHFDVENSDRTLLTDMTAQVFFITSEARAVVTVPVGALTFTDKKRGRSNRAATVQVVNEDDEPETRAVTIGIASRIAAEVIDGLQPGETVIAGILEERESDSRSRRGTYIRF